jgi:tungstate transport system substrate-binding protein
MLKNRKLSAILLAMSILLTWNLSAEGQYEKETTHIKLATTTSTENSGLLAELLPLFQKDADIIVDVIAVGTGKAIAHGENGDVDLILVHARSREDAFVEAGFGVNRRDVMHNDFVILGPTSDPAGIKGMSSAAEALAAVAAANENFMSRGDDSGTHTKEKSLWKSASLTPEGEWYKETGQGMGAVLTMTNEVQGYTMTDRGTWLAMKEKLDLEILLEGDPVLFNPYGVIAVNPEKHSHVDYEGAMAFITFLTGPKGQTVIREFKKNGEQLFYPDASK